MKKITILFTLLLCLGLSSCIVNLTEWTSSGFTIKGKELNNQFIVVNEPVTLEWNVSTVVQEYLEGYRMTTIGEYHTDENGVSTDSYFNKEKPIFEVTFKEEGDHFIYFQPVYNNKAVSHVPAYQARVYVYKTAPIVNE